MEESKSKNNKLLNEISINSNNSDNVGQNSNDEKMKNIKNENINLINLYHKTRLFGLIKIFKLKIKYLKILLI